MNKLVLVALTLEITIRPVFAGIEPFSSSWFEMVTTRLTRNEHDRRYAIWSCKPLDGGQGPRPAKNISAFFGCAGLGNRVFGLATTLLYALVTDRAFRIQWPGGEELQLKNFFSPLSDATDWTLNDFSHASSKMILDDRIDRNFVMKTLLMEDFVLHQQQAVFITCNEAFFVDIFRNPHCQQRLHQIGLWHPDMVLGLLRFILTPTGELKKAVAQVQSQLAHCHVIGLQIRLGTPQTGSYSVLGDDHDDAARCFVQGAEAIEESLAPGTPCVKWFLSTDSALLADVLEHRYPNKIVRYVGQPAHLDSTMSAEDHLKIYVDYWSLALSHSIVITIPSTFGFSARLLNLTGSTTFKPIVAKQWMSSTIRRQVQSDITCGSLRHQCFCGPMSWAGDLCTDSDRRAKIVAVELSGLALVHDLDEEDFAAWQIHVGVYTVIFGEVGVLPVANLVAREAQIYFAVNDEMFAKHMLRFCDSIGPCNISTPVPAYLLDAECNTIEAFLDPIGDIDTPGIGASHGIMRKVVSIGLSKRENEYILCPFHSMDQISASSGPHPAESLCVIRASVLAEAHSPGTYDIDIFVSGLSEGSSYRLQSQISSANNGEIGVGATKSNQI